MKKTTVKMRKVQYFETEDHLKWFKKNLGNHQMSEFIRQAVTEKMVAGKSFSTVSER